MMVSTMTLHRLMDQVAAQMPLSQTMLFWEWLGNVKFKEDGHSLSAERAEEIRRTLASLVQEYEGTP